MVRKLDWKWNARKKKKNQQTSDEKLGVEYPSESNEMLGRDLFGNLLKIPCQIACTRLSLCNAAKYLNLLRNDKKPKKITNNNNNNNNCETNKYILCLLLNATHKKIWIKCEWSVRLKYTFTMPMKIIYPGPGPWLYAGVIFNYISCEQTQRKCSFRLFWMSDVPWKFMLHFVRKPHFPALLSCLT